jgi:DNA replication protein DnaC
MNVIITPQENLLDLLCNESEWQKNGLDPKKSLLIMGNAGVGKSYTLNEYQKKTLKNRGRTVDSNYISRGLQQEQNEFYSRFYTDNMVWEDLGREGAKHLVYGVEHQVADRIFEIRYFRHPVLKTHITTNLTPELIEQVYGERMMSRLHEMMNFILVTGKDLRKNP